jgi:hypothetical protein
MAICFALMMWQFDSDSNEKGKMGVIDRRTRQKRRCRRISMPHGTQVSEIRKILKFLNTFGFFLTEFRHATKPLFCDILSEASSSFQLLQELP